MPASEEGEFPEPDDGQLVRCVEAGESFFPGPAVSILPGGKIEALIGIIDTLAKSISGLEVVPCAEGSSQGHGPAVIGRFEVVWRMTIVEKLGLIPSKRPSNISPLKRLTST